MDENRFPRLQNLQPVEPVNQTRLRLETGPKFRTGPGPRIQTGLDRAIKN